MEREYDDVQEFGHDEVEPELQDPEEPEEGEEPDEKPVDDDIPASLPETSLADEPESKYSNEPKRKQPKHNKAQARINEITREKYAALSELDRARSENEHLKKMYELSSQAAMRQYDDNVAKRIENARRKQIEAIEAGDAQAQADANIEVASATNELQTLNNWKYQKEYETRQRELLPPEPPYARNAPILDAWVQQNTWLNPDSDDHEPDVTDHVIRCSEYLDNQLMHSGRGHEIRSRAYFDQLNNEAYLFRQNRNVPAQPERRGLNMKSVRGGASPARGQSQGLQPTEGRRDITLSADERDMARRMGVTDKAYLQQRVRDEQENGFRRRGGR